MLEQAQRNFGHRVKVDVEGVTEHAYRRPFEVTLNADLGRLHPNADRRDPDGLNTYEPPGVFKTTTAA